MKNNHPKIEYPESSPNMTVIQEKYVQKGIIPRMALFFYFKTLRTFIQPFTSLKTLEVGCGEGFILQTLTRSGFSRLTGIDRDKQRIAIAKRMNPSADLIVADAHILPFQSGAFDLVFLLEVLEHVGDPNMVLQEVERVTTRYVIISIPHEPFWRMGNMVRGKYWGSLGNTPEHIHHWGIFGIKKLVSQYFIIKKIRLSFLWIFILAQKKV